MSSSENETRLDALRQQIFSKSDARLRRKIEDRLDIIRREVPSGDVIFLARETDQTAQMINVVLTGPELVTALSDIVFDDRKDQARTEAVNEFFNRVETMRTG